MEEIRRSPVDVDISVFIGFRKHPRWLFGISEPSTVWNWNTHTHTHTHTHTCLFFGKNGTSFFSKKKHPSLGELVDFSLLGSGWFHRRLNLLFDLMYFLHKIYGFYASMHSVFQYKPTKGGKLRSSPQKPWPLGSCTIHGKSICRKRDPFFWS